jgi:hypothetical protein
VVAKAPFRCSYEVQDQLGRRVLGDDFLTEYNAAWTMTERLALARRLLAAAVTDDAVSTMAMFDHTAKLADDLCGSANWLFGHWLDRTKRPKREEMRRLYRAANAVADQTLTDAALSIVAHRRGGKVADLETERARRTILSLVGGDPDDE